jgi:hypothetical protein
MNDGGHLGYPDASRPREQDIISVPEIVGHGCVNFGSTWVEPMDIMRVPIWSFVALSKVEALRELKQLQGHTMDLIEV